VQYFYLDPALLSLSIYFRNGYGFEEVPVHVLDAQSEVIFEESATCGLKAEDVVADLEKLHNR
jgi:hypothetical protein